MQIVLHKIIAGVVSVAISGLSFFGLVPEGKLLEQKKASETHIAVLEQQLQNKEYEDVLGAYNITGGGTYRLKTSVGGSDSSISLSSFKEPVSNNSYTMSYLNTSIAYGTIDPQTTRSEFISFTGITQNADGSASLTGVSRGLTRSPAGSACTASTTLSQRHPGQSIFILSDSPCHFTQYPVKQNDETITGFWSFPTPVAAANPVTKAYADALSFGGVATATESSVGFIELATQLEQASSTALGSTMAPVVLQAKYSTSTWNSATAALRVVVTQNSGKIDNNFIASTTLFATSSILNSPISMVGKNMQVFTSTGTTTFSVPASVSKFSIRVVGGGGGGSTAAVSSSGGGGGGGGYSIETVDLTGTSTVQVFVGSGGAGGSTGTAGTWSTFGTNGFYLSASGGSGASSNGGAGVGGAGGVGSGGDINGEGGDGGGCFGTSAGSCGGSGGSSILGGGGTGGGTTGSVGTNAGAGNLYGGGGGGGAGGTGGGGSGGGGAQGIVIVSW